jgi:hypothetical protein
MKNPSRMFPPYMLVPQQQLRMGGSRCSAS